MCRLVNNTRNRLNGGQRCRYITSARARFDMWSMRSTTAGSRHQDRYWNNGTGSRYFDSGLDANLGSSLAMDPEAAAFDRGPPRSRKIVTRSEEWGGGGLGVEITATVPFSFENVFSCFFDNYIEPARPARAVLARAAVGRAVIGCDFSYCLVHVDPFASDLCPRWIENVENSSPWELWDCMKLIEYGSSRCGTASACSGAGAAHVGPRSIPHAYGAFSSEGLKRACAVRSMSQLV
ncbi:hypothetical protein EVAR_53592_1 [Eumeta japonica]|uniref:Uncharacterized protein n=1 Tax=Eumeta variegata TaxID=151549 RepID=A0A4C1YGQ1_EUMVA|nr:hypothetical protein EVAR_53592_1 [Eumeta japonica]